ncbi:Vsp/OspC family lipoprotein [Borrelia duttonii]|uniref:Vsp protein n=1 Tax=Borrelia duttonii (strain Ly) TaxID=412419 RepID=B5RN65_BORDL|nr:vsp protein [Borrelia duttonii Ly]
MKEEGIKGIKGKEELGNIEECRMGRRVKGIVMVMVVMMGCNSGGVSGEGTGEEGKGRKGDGSVIDLKGVSKKIRDAVEFAGSVKEVETLVKSIDALAKAIGKKIQAAGATAANANQNDSLVVGAYNIISDAKAKLEVLEAKAGKFSGIKEKVASAKSSSKSLLDKWAESHGDLGKGGAEDSAVKKAMDKSDATGGKGKKELEDLNKEIVSLIIDVTNVVEDEIKKLTEKPVKPAFGD